MGEQNLLDHLPLWGLVLATLATLVVAVEGGYRLGIYRGRTSMPEKASPVGAVVAATLSLSAFMLAFTFGLAASRLESRREVLQEEVNAIGTTYLRASFLPDDHGPKVRALLRDYVDVRLETLKPNAPISDLIHQAENLHSKLWNEAVLAVVKKDTELVSLFIESLNQVIDAHAKRVTAGIRARIPTSVWLALYFLTIVSIASMGFYTGLTGTARSIASLGMILSCLVVIWLIADLDRPREGVLRVNQQGMFDVRESINSELP